MIGVVYIGEMAPWGLLGGGMWRRGVRVGGGKRGRGLQEGGFQMEKGDGERDN